MHSYVITDVFTDTPFEGNALAVFPDGAGVPADRMQRIAREMNLSETVFVLPAEAGGAALQPDLGALARLPDVGANGFAGEGKRWKTRMFGPAYGVAEDPATGSAAGPLAVHLARHGRIAFGEEIEISQGAEVGRPSTLYAQADGSVDGLERLRVGGSAVTVARGEFTLP